MTLAGRFLITSHRRSITFSSVLKTSFRNPLLRISFQICSMGFISGVYGGMKIQRDLSRNNQSICLVPHGPVTHQQYLILRVCPGQFRQENIHAVCVAVRKNQKETFPVLRLYCSICVAVFTNMMTWNGWPFPFPAPAALWFIDSSEAGLILKHHPHVSAWILDDDFVIPGLNFFEESCSSCLAALECFDLGIIFRHPCRFITLYT